MKYSISTPKKYRAMGLWALATVLFFTGCEKFLEEKPDKKLATPTTFKDLQALLDAQTMNVAIYPTGPDIASDDFYFPDNTYRALVQDYRENYVWHNTTQLSFDWRFMYNKVFTANIVLDNLDKVKPSGDSPAAGAEIKGAALFFRAFAFYNLLQVFALPYDRMRANDLPGIPLRFEPGIEIPVVRSNMANSYQQVLADLKMAVPHLPVTPLFKTRPSRPAAYAMLARTYLVMGHAAEAYRYADSCLQLYHDLMRYSTISLTANNPFPQFNKEVIFHASTSGRGSAMNQSRARVDTLLYDSYNSRDLRKKLFYKAGTGVGQVFKGDYAGKNFANLFNGLATDEVMLVKAEAAIRKDGAQNIAEGIAIVNELLETRWEPGAFVNYPENMDREAALTVVLAERRKELAFRGGIRWSDVKRLQQDSGHQVTLRRKIGGELFTLAPGDKRFAFLIPQEVIQLSNIPQNER